MTDTPLGIIAGSGHLPLAVARAQTASGRGVFVLGIEDAADPALNDYPSALISLGQIEHAANLLTDAGCREVLFIGGVKRPDLSLNNISRLRVDKGGRWVLKQFMLQRGGGDDTLLSIILQYFENKNFTIADPRDLLAPMLGQAGVQGRVGVGVHKKDTQLAMQAARAIGQLDIGQCAVVCRNQIIAVEAAEGTDRLLQRLLDLPPQALGTADTPTGVLAKSAKPGQNLRVDLPTLGVPSVRLAYQAHLAGIAYQAGLTLLDDREAIIAEADKCGLFLIGLDDDSN